jgi:CRISPR-associated endonuclease Cas1
VARSERLSDRILRPLHSAGLELREAQFAAAKDSRRLSIARDFVAAKIVNMAGLMRRREPSALRSAVRSLTHLARKARHASHLNELLGLERTATAQYFNAWPAMISERARGLEFGGRTRRPPQDAINAALSYSYAVLAGEALAAAVAAGLEPRLGFLHARRAGRPALALDLMEPFRPLIADRAVLAGVNTGRFEDQHFQEREGGVWLTEAGRRLALTLIEDRLSAWVTVPGRDAACSYREAIGYAAASLAATLTGGTPLMLVEQP